MNVTELKEKLATDKEFKEEFLAARKNNKLDAFFKAQGCDFTAEQLKEQRHAAKAESGELLDDSLTGVTGGTGVSGSKIVGPYDSCEHFVCLYCGKSYAELLPVTKPGPRRLSGARRWRADEL